LQVNNSEHFFIKATFKKKRDADYEEDCPHKQIEVFQQTRG